MAILEDVPSYLGGQTKDLTSGSPHWMHLYFEDHLAAINHNIRTCLHVNFKNHNKL